MAVRQLRAELRLANVDDPIGLLASLHLKNVNSGTLPGAGETIACVRIRYSPHRRQPNLVTGGM